MEKNPYIEKVSAHEKAHKAMRDLLTIIFFLSLLAVPAGFLLLPKYLGIPVAIIGALTLQVSHYQLNQVKEEEPGDGPEVLDDEWI